MSRLTAGLLQLAAYWSVVWLLRDQPVSGQAWAGLALLCMVGAQTMPVKRVANIRPRHWLLIAVNLVIVAALFWGADAGRKLIDAGDAEYAQQTSLPGGLEVWWVLCPGLASVLLATWAASVLFRPSGE